MEWAAQRAAVHRNNAAPAAADENPMTGKMLCLNDTLSLGILFNNNLAFQPTKRPAGGSKTPQCTRPRQRLPFIRVKPDRTTLKDNHQPRLLARRTGEPSMQEAATPNPIQESISATPPLADAIIRAERIEKYYAQPSQNRIQVISATDLSIVPGEIVALLGPSGSGKSTMLRMLSGLSTPTSGRVYWHERPIADAEINVSIVFQSFALFPWLTVLENVEAPLQARGVAAGERLERSMKMLDTVGLDGFEAAYPKELSGGMKQRVGFARALVVEPEVLFMDEPFSALDVLTAENLRSELLELWANKTMPTKAVFLVTHNPHGFQSPARAAPRP
jgi:ABC-type nitrate/sulfonate/bicarbonate transport system ATPase subunit